MIKVTLVEPIEGFEKDAEYRLAKKGEYFLSDGRGRTGHDEVLHAGIDTVIQYIVLKNKTAAAE